MTHTLDILARIHNDGTGTYIQVAPNADGLEGLWDLKYVDSTGKDIRVFTINKEEADLLVKAISSIILGE
jgi:hypothetical protein